MSLVGDEAATNRHVTLAVRGLMLGADRYRQVIAELHGVSVPAVIVLGDLYQSGALTPRSIAARLAWTTGGVTALLDRLERQNYINRVPNPDDRRSVLVELTRQGDQVMQHVFDHLESAVDHAIRTEQLDADPVASFLEHIAEALRSPDDSDGYSKSAEVKP